jgi:hypothetical protein
VPKLANLSCAVLLLGLSLSLTSPVFAADYSDWYQVEVVIFAHKTPTQSDEIWPVTQLSYPDQMISIAPQAAPFSAQQVRQLEDYLDLFNGNVNGEFDADDGRPEANNANEFLFQSRSRLQVADEITPGTADMGSDFEGGLENDLEVAIDYEALFQSDAPHAFVALPEERRILNSQARSISRSSLYKTLVHQSWLQPIVSDKDSLPILIQAGDHFDDMYELDGTITINRSRFLHVDADLWYTEFSPLYQQGDAAVSTAESLLAPEPLSPQLRSKYPQVARWESTRGQYLKVHSHPLQQSRRMRSSTLHFIDHPRFGILIRIEGFDPMDSD